MWWIIGITVLALIGVILIIRSAKKDADENMNDSGGYSEYNINKIYGEIYMQNDMEEHSPESIISDKLIKRVSLRDKLNKIEEEKN